MPKCAWLLLTSLLALLHHTIGLAATINFLLAAITWTLATPAALVAVASLSAWHLLNAHTPQAFRRRTPRPTPPTP
jgi:hypothetical protein